MTKTTDDTIVQPGSWKKGTGNFVLSSEFILNCEMKWEIAVIPLYSIFCILSSVYL